MASESSIVIGSGLNPVKLLVPPNATSNKSHLKGTNSVILNPEDSSAGRGGLVTQMTIGVVAVQIPSTPLEYRRAIAIRNNSTLAKLYIGFSPTVSTADGFPLNPGESLPLEFNAAIPIWGIADTTADIRILEVS